MFSRYSTLLGVPNEILGIIYFAGVMAYSILASIMPELVIPLVYNLFLTVVSIAGIFSVVLVGLQVLKLKELCEWCLSTAVFTVAIALLVWI